MMSANGGAVSMLTPSPDLLGGKVAIILGASRGIGAATARFFGAAGAKVVAAARDAGALGTVVANIREAGGEATAIAVDAREADQVAALVEKTTAKYGGLDLAFNNAGEGNPPRPLVDTSVDELDLALSLNLRGIIVAMKFQVAAMLAGGKGGAIVNMASTAGLQGARGLTAYSAAKHGIIGATKSVALEVAAKNIRVNVVAPGPVLNDKMAELTPEQRVPIERAVPLGRIGRPEEIASAVAWLCSDHADFITGAVLSIDGGRLAGYHAG
jgi:NAD(P)-dependent dehydrogenase (short-subunit alcohol dehydrogenase family)